MDSNAAILQSSNLFMFTMHNPVMFVDPTGLFIIPAQNLFAMVTNAMLTNALLNSIETAPGLLFMGRDEVTDKCKTITEAGSPMMPGGHQSGVGSVPPKVFPPKPPAPIAPKPATAPKPAIVPKPKLSVQATVPKPKLSAQHTSLPANNARMTTSEALNAADQFLGTGARDMGRGRFVSADGLRQVRMGNSDILGHHGGGAHINFEVFVPHPITGRMERVVNSHVYLTD